MDKRRAAGLLFISIVFCIAMFCVVGCAAGENPIGEIYGVFARDIDVIYDGTAYAIQPINVLDTDEVFYSQNISGPWRSERIAYSEPGDYKVYYKVVRAGCNDYISSAAIKIARGVLRGITAEDRLYIYDGEAHGIEVMGVPPGHTVLYSTDGEIFTPECAIVEPGEYTVYYRVSDDYCDYFDDCTVTVLPDISGRYLNEYGGLVVLDRFSATIDGKSVSLEYDVDGRGEIAGKPFASTDSGIEFDGAVYKKLNRGEYVYSFDVGESIVFAAASDTAELSILFDTDDGSADITVDGDVVFTRHGVNYCENISGCELSRRYDSSDVSVTIRSVAEVTTIEVELSMRSVRDVVLDTVYVFHDGKPHAAVANVPDRVLYLRDGLYVSESPKFAAVGEYDVSVLVLSDEYLPTFSSFGFVIMPNIDGVYYNTVDIIEVAGYTAACNGAEVSCEYLDGAWYIAGTRAELVANGLEVCGAVFTRLESGKRAVRLEFFGERIVLLDPRNIIVSVSGGSVTVGGDVFLESDTNYADVVVLRNGVIADGIDNDGTEEYIFGIAELDNTVTIITVRSE